MPLADDAGAVAGLFQHGGERVAAGLDDQGGVAGQHARALVAPGVLAGEQGVARRRAGGGRGVRVGETHARGRSAIQIRRVDARGAVATDVAVAEIVGVHVNDVGTARGGGEAGLRQQGQ